MVFPIKVDEYALSDDFKNKMKLEFQIWDKDLLSANDFMSSAEVELAPLIEAVVSSQTRMFLKEGFASSKGGSRDWILYTKPNPNGSDELQKPSQIKISIELVPEDE